MPKRHKNLFGAVASVRNLFAAARKAMLGKRGKAPVARCFVELEKLVLDLREELLEGRWQPGAYYYFQVREPKLREVAAAPFRDRIVHHALVRVLEPIFDRRFIADSFACRPGKGTHAGLARAREFTRRYRYCLKCDIRKYFASMDHGVLLGQIARVVADADVMDVVARIVASHADGVGQVWPPGGELFDVERRPRGLPIGNLTSQFFANVYLHPMDCFVKHTLGVKGYVRYVDDFLLFGDDRSELAAFGRRLKAFVKGLRLRMHPEKYRLARTETGVDFVGFVSFPDGRVRVRDGNVRRFERRMKLQSWCVRTGRMSLEDVRRRALAWVHHAQHAQSRHLRDRIFAKLDFQVRADALAAPVTVREA